MNRINSLQVNCHDKNTMETKQSTNTLATWWMKISQYNRTENHVVIICKARTTVNEK
jgi:hypothetical protein